MLVGSLLTRARCLFFDSDFTSLDLSNVSPHLELVGLDLVLFRPDVGLVCPDWDRH